MSYKINFDIDLDKALMKIPKHDAKLLKEKIESLAEDPRPHGSIKLHIQGIADYITGSLTRYCWECLEFCVINS